MKISSIEPYRINSNPLIVTRQSYTPSLRSKSSSQFPDLSARDNSSHAKPSRFQAGRFSFARPRTRAPRSLFPRSPVCSFVNGPLLHPSAFIVHHASSRRAFHRDPSTTARNQSFINAVVTRPIKEHHRCNGYTLEKDTCTFIFVFVSGDGTLGDITF